MQWFRQKIHHGKWISECVKHCSEVETAFRTSLVIALHFIETRNYRSHHKQSPSLRPAAHHFANVDYIAKVMGFFSISYSWITLSVHYHIIHTDVDKWRWSMGSETKRVLRWFLFLISVDSGPLKSLRPIIIRRIRRPSLRLSLAEIVDVNPRPQPQRITDICGYSCD